MTKAMATLNREDLALLRQASREGMPPVLALADRLSLTPRDAARLLAERLSLHYLDSALLAGLRPDPTRLPLALAQQQQCALLVPADATSVDAEAIALLSDPFDEDRVLQLQHQSGGRCTLAVAAPEDVRAFLQHWEQMSSALDTLDGDTQTPVSAQRVETLSFATVAEAGSRASMLVNSTLLDAHRAGASDVHFESTDTGFAVRYRIDGVLDMVKDVPGRDVAEQVVSRIKVLSGLDIAEHRVPQDGSYRVRVREHEVDLRISVMPSVHGEDVVVRILDKQSIIESAGKLSLDALGFDTDTRARLRRLLDEPYGMVLVTGPTGSGKTTTLYAALSELHTGREKIITIEDPVEYQLHGMLQIPVNEKKQLTFARGLRSILRHDPDIIMVGEIRDRETAEIAVQSALTGHLVLSTVHANSVLDVFGRFAHMGLDIYALVSAINGVWAQRLVRLNCPSCSQDDVPDDAQLARLGLGREQVLGYHFRRGIGCGECRNTGYRGRQAIAEILRVDGDIREMLLAKRSMREVREAAVSGQDMRSITEIGLDLVKAGQTTLEEIRRVASSQ